MNYTILFFLICPLTLNDNNLPLFNRNIIQVEKGIATSKQTVLIKDSIIENIGRKYQS